MLQLTVKNANPPNISTRSRAIIQVTGVQSARALLTALPGRSFGLLALYGDQRGIVILAVVDHGDAIFNTARPSGRSCATVVLVLPALNAEYECIHARAPELEAGALGKTLPNRRYGLSGSQNVDVA